MMMKRQLFLFIILILSVQSYAQTDNIRKVRPNLAAAIGFFSPDGPNEWLENTYGSSSVVSGSLKMSTYFHLRIGLKIQTGEKFQIEPLIEESISPKNVNGESHSFNRYGTGCLVNFKLAGNNGKDFYLGGGVCAYFMQFQGYQNFAVGPSFQAEFYLPVKKVFLVPFIGGTIVKTDGEKSGKPDMELNYSGVHLGIKFCF